MPYVIPPRRFRNYVLALSSAALLVGLVPAAADASETHHRAHSRHHLTLHDDPYARVAQGAE